LILIIILIMPIITLLINYRLNLFLILSK
jgi:hypothetical protein